MPDSLCRRFLSFGINLGLFVAANTQITSVYGDGLTQHQFNIDYTADIWTNVRGGQKRGSAYLDNLDVTLGVDTETLFGLKNGNGYQELNFELTWRIRLSERWVLQPDLQFIHHPGTAREIGDAIAFGLRFELNIF